MDGSNFISRWSPMPWDGRAERRAALLQAGRETAVVIAALWVAAVLMVAVTPPEVSAALGDELATAWAD